MCGWTAVCSVCELYESVYLYVPPSLSFPFHHSFSTSISVCTLLTIACVSSHFVSVCLFCYLVSFVLLLNKLTFDVSPLLSLSSLLLSFSLPSFVVWTMVDDCALGDLLLDPVSVRCRDERKAMKGVCVYVRKQGGGEQMEDRAVHREMKKAERGGK